MMSTQAAKQLMHRIDALTLRERLFMLAGVMMIIGGLWEAMLAAPLASRERAAALKIESTRERLAQLDASMAIAAEGIGGGITDQFDRLQSLRREIASSEDTVRVFTSDLVDPAQMRFVLEDLIRRQGKLELIRATNRPVRPVIEPETPDDEPAEREGARLYRHGLLLELEGSYLDCLEYLEAVEQLPWQIYWTGLRVQTDEHPRNRITLELATLSLEEDWIGV